MNIGDYVRTKEYIRKIRKIEQEYIYCDIGVFTENEIIKSSLNIIDILEVGDFITYKHKNMYWNIPTRVYGKSKNGKTIFMVDDYNLDEIEVLSIVTKEQFESMEYKVDNNE